MEMTKEKGIRKFIGSRDFYAHVLAISVPMMLQNLITNFVGMLDNIMIGLVGTEQMSGVAIVNQLMFVFNISIFGAISGAGIFTAQFYGRNDQEGVRNTFRFKVYTCMLLLIGCILIFLFKGEQLIMLYLHGDSQVAELQQALDFGKSYLRVMLFGLPPFAVEQIYTSTIRECGETKVPMIAGIVAVVLNLILNALLIFGWLGFPELGVVGAAIATVISRYVQVMIVIVWTHTHTLKVPFIVGAYKTLRIPHTLAVHILKKGTPLMLNEMLWAAGIAILNQCYSLRGMDVVAAQNISATISNLFNVVFIAMGSAISIIVGQLLGAGKLQEARDTDRKLIAFSVATCLVMGTALALVSPLFPMIYKTTDLVRYEATCLIRISAICMPFAAFMHATYFTMRSGGKTFVTFLFDSVFMWVVSIPTAYALSRFTDLPIIPLYALCQSVELIKCGIGLALLKKGIWIQTLEAGSGKAEAS